MITPDYVAMEMTMANYGSPKAGFRFDVKAAGRVRGELQLEMDTLVKKLLRPSLTYQAKSLHLSALIKSRATSLAHPTVG